MGAYAEIARYIKENSELRALLQPRLRKQT
jgi:hypothetical protein